MNITIDIPYIQHLKNALSSASLFPLHLTNTQYPTNITNNNNTSNIIILIIKKKDPGSF